MIRGLGGFWRGEKRIVAREDNKKSNVARTSVPNNLPLVASLLAPRSWDKFDVWEEGRGGVWRGFYEGKEVETEEEGVDGEEMTEEELKEFGIEWR